MINDPGVCVRVDLVEVVFCTLTAACGDLVGEQVSKKLKSVEPSLERFVPWNVALCRAVVWLHGYERPCHAFLSNLPPRYHFLWRP